MENKTISMLDEIQEAKSTDVLLIEGEYETNKITMLGINKFKISKYIITPLNLLLLNILL